MSRGDKRLDPFSPEFDPLTAIYSQSVELPCASAPVYDNISRFQISGSQVTIKTDKVATGKKSKKNIDITEGWDNAVSRMGSIEGPLAMLKKCIDKTIKIKVVTRTMNGIRGYLIGNLIAFDKMWNLVMEDVNEVWTRKKKKKCPPLLGSSTVITPDRRKLMKNPEVKITSINSKLEKCERYLKKFIMRGEHVVLISFLNK